MSFFNFFGSNKKKFESQEFFDYLNGQVKYLELKENVELGMFFFLGASQINHLNHSPFDLGIDAKDQSRMAAFMYEIISMYSESDGDFAQFGDLNDHVFQYQIYNTAYIINDVLLESESNIDSYLRTVDDLNVSIGKTDIDIDLMESYAGKPYRLNVIQNLLDGFFASMGDHLLAKGYDNKKSYDAGFAYYNMQVQMDSKGSMALFRIILTGLSPMYEAIWQFPVLFKMHKDHLYANHVFSSVLQFLYGGNANNTVNAIHRFHQWLFYKKGTSDIKDAFNFKSVEQDAMVVNLYHYSFEFRKAYMEQRSLFTDYKDIIDQELIDIEISKKDLFGKIVVAIHEKYGVAVTQKGWNSHGDYLQALAIFFYETSLHIMLPETILSESGDVL